MKNLEKILVNIIGTIVATYAGIVLLFSLPFIQNRLANWTANILSNELKTKVEIGNINLGFLNRIIVNDMAIYEPDGKPMASIARVSASINLFSLVSGKIDIGTAQLFGTKVTLYKQTAESAPNYQFVIDAFTSEQKEQSTPINLRIGSFIIRHADINYDIKSEEKQPNTLDANHIHLHDCGMNIALRSFSKDSLNISVRRLQASELNSGLSLHDTHFKLIANSKQARLTDFSISLPHSHASIDSLNVDFQHFKNDSTFTLRSTPLTGTIVLKDLASIEKKLDSFNTPFHFSFSVIGNEKTIAVPDFNVYSGKNITFKANMDIFRPINKELREIHSHISYLNLRDEEIPNIVNTFIPNYKDSLIHHIKDITYSGNIKYNSDKEFLSDGNIKTAIGSAEYDIIYDANKILSGVISGDSVHIGKILNDKRLGTTSFNFDVVYNTISTQTIPSAKALGKIHHIAYNGYNYNNISIDAQSYPTGMKGMVDIDDENLKSCANITYIDAPHKDIQLDLSLDKIHFNNLNLVKTDKEEELSLKAIAQLRGKDFKHLYGNIEFNDINLQTKENNYSLKDIIINAQKQENETSLYTINSEILTASIEGQASLADIVANFTNQLSHHLPILVKKQNIPATDFTYEITVKDAPVLHSLTDTKFALKKPVRMFGNLSSDNEQMSLNIDAPSVSYNEKDYDDIALVCNTTPDNMNVHAIASTYKESDDEEIPSSSTKLDFTADIHNNIIYGDMYINTAGRNNITMQLLPVIQFSDSLGSTKTDITLRKSNAVINDTTWTISPSRISLYQKSLECDQVMFANDNTNSFLSINGRASESSSDSLVATLKNLEIKYILTLINFHVVHFAGKASGQAIFNNIMAGGTPNIHANLSVENLSIQEGPLGNANITAKWDEEIEGISVEGRIVDLYRVPDALTGREKNITGITTVNGWISPARNDIQINVGTHNTNASFIHGFLGGIFKEVNGYVTGPISIIGPLNDVNIVGDAVPHMNLRLRATNVPYHIEGDTLHLRPYLFDFKDISIYDRFGHRSTLNGQVTHRNMKNFKYDFHVNLHELLAYDEHEFNSDKFLATVFANGTLTVSGSDGHPLYVNANVTPTKGSVFAYDAATPDAITGNSFIEFRDRDSLQTFHSDIKNAYSSTKTDTEKDSLTIVKEAKKNYNSDIYINFDINLTPDCEVKLRMDNIEDGYMRTFGHAKLTAQWYNKGTFQLFGNYNINSGFYRLYLQDIIFRDLALQPGSLVEFNGNPFDANIHLICHHTINSVPLSDLTSTTAFTQNNKVKVIGILDITGKLGNMDFKFDMNIPNVSEEVRQLVRSMINSEEEMNTQMIYLLGLGRFYPNEYARNNGGNNSEQAMNSLLSSTLSGQINQMLSNMIGTNANWNFGSSLTTGEKGWDDLDVEGLLEGKLFDERLLINGAFGYRDNALTDQGNFIGDFEVKWRMSQNGNLYFKAYNQTNDRYFTKATLNTQGIGLSWRHDFESIRKRLKSKEKKTKKIIKPFAKKKVTQDD